MGPACLGSQLLALEPRGRPRFAGLQRWSSPQPRSPPLRPLQASRGTAQGPGGARSAEPTSLTRGALAVPPTAGRPPRRGDSGPWSGCWSWAPGWREACAQRCWGRRRPVLCTSLCGTRLGTQVGRLPAETGGKEAGGDHGFWGGLGPTGVSLWRKSSSSADVWSRDRRLPAPVRPERARGWKRRPRLGWGRGGSAESASEGGLSGLSGLGGVLTGVCKAWACRCR